MYHGNNRDRHGRETVTASAGKLTCAAGSCCGGGAAGPEFRTFSLVRSGDLIVVQVDEVEPMLSRVMEHFERIVGEQG